MSQSRRDFIKYVVAGSIASGCPIDIALLEEPGGAAATPLVEGEHFAICHQVRDGHSFPKPEATKKVGVVIVGGGVSGLSAAYFLKGKDWLLLEKEDHFGGNAYQEEYEGQIFGTGAAYGYRGDPGDQLAKEIGLDMPLINMPDPIIDNGKYAPDIWRTGINDLPYSKEVVSSFKKYRDDIMKIDIRKNMAELDQESFTKYLVLRPRNHQALGRLRPLQLGRLLRGHLRADWHRGHAISDSGVRRPARNSSRRPRLHYPQTR
jgi:phytoene dehydrogenase-like protein